MIEHPCKLCGQETLKYLTFRNKDYYKCSNCESIQLDSKFYISLEKEKIRYELHNNDIADLGYQNFVKPITGYVFDNLKSTDRGLDFGAGHGPVISEILKNKGFDIKIYDPFFHNYKDLLNNKYDYIISCEVIEHFHNPKKEFEMLSSMLNNQGKLIIMTDPLKQEIDFQHWYYKNDETHVFFYSTKTFEYIKKEFNFKELSIKNRLIILEKL